MSYRSRFTQVNYDAAAGEKQWKLRREFIELEKYVIENEEKLGKWSEVPFNKVLQFAQRELPNGRGNGRGTISIMEATAAVSVDDCLCHLEAAYMWFGKSIRDEMLNRLPK